MSNYIKTESGFYIKGNIDANIAISYPTEGNKNCYEMETHSQWFQARNTNISDIIQRFPFKGDFLDIGGGNGYQLSHLQQTLFREKGITSAMCEPGPEGCSNAASRGVNNVYCTLVEDFPFNEYNIGGIGLFDVIEHIEDDAAFLNMLVSIIPNGTRIYITVPALKFLWSSEDQYAGHYRRYNLQEEARILKKTKLKLVYSGYFFSYYVPFVWLLRVMPEKLGKKVSPSVLQQRESQFHRQSGKLNLILNAAHKVEMLFFSRSILKNLLGTSRLIVLEK